MQIDVGILRGSSPTLRSHNGSCLWTLTIAGFDVNIGNMVAPEIVLPAKVTTQTNSFILKCVIDLREELEAVFTVYGW